jgi:Na+/proline symporter
MVFPHDSSFTSFCSGIGSSILYAYPEVGALAGLLGTFMYAFGSIIPLFAFAWLGPLIRKKCPGGFTLTQFILERFGRITQIYISLMSIAYMFCFMISELSAFGDILELLTGVSKYGPVIALAVITTIYTGTYFEFLFLFARKLNNFISLNRIWRISCIFVYG